jgi:GNAT superfamily N-acetyltransferase
MKLFEVNNKRTIKSFHQLPFRIYKNTNVWVPHLLQDIEPIFNKSKNKQLRHGEVIRWILLDDNAVVIGRVAAFVNRKMKSGKIAVGGMGFFECTEDKKAAFLLFDACKNWLKERDCQAMDGPINFGEKDKFWGLLVEGFDNPSVYANNYNPAYYQSFFEDYGFKTYYNQHVSMRAVTAPLQEKYKIRAERIAEDKEYTFEHIRKKNKLKYAEDFRIVYNKAWGNSFRNFRKMKQKQAVSIINKMSPIMDEKIIWFAYYKEDPIAFSIFLPELNEIFKYINGNFNFFGKIKFWLLLKFCPPKNVHGVVFGVTPDFQKKGVEGALIQQISNQFLKSKKYENIIMTWVGDFNPKMLKLIEGLGATDYQKLKTYRLLFDKNANFERYPIHS